MTYKLVIDTTLNGLNDYQYACRSHFSKGNKMKREQVWIVSLYIIQQLKDVHITKPVRIDFHWYEPNRKRDLDNISSFGRKVIQDALVETNVLKNDGWFFVKGFSDSFFVDKEHPRVEVFINEIDE